MGAENEENEWQVVGFRAWDEIGGLDLEEMKDRRSTVNLPVSLARFEILVLIEEF